VQLQGPYLDEKTWGVISSRSAVISYVISRILTVVLDITLSSNKHIPPPTGPSPKDNLIFTLYSTSLFKFDNPFPQGLYKRLANNKNRYGGIWKAGLLLHVGYYSYPINILSNIFP
jgi:hypothetical protein